MANTDKTKDGGQGAPGEEQGGMRLQQYLARAGVASRRRSEELIAAGRVSVNGSVVTEMGCKIDPNADEVCFDGKPVAKEEFLYICFYKPPHVVASAHDPQGRKTVQDFMRGVPARVFNVGRLDYDSEGVLLMTNDGDLANGLLHPRYEVDKKYYVVCRGHLTPHVQAQLRKGVVLDGRKTAPADLEILEEMRSTTRLNITIREGRNRQVRRMFEALGHQVSFLRRDGFGNLSLDGLSPGRWRYVEGAELAALRRLAGLGGKADPKANPPTGQKVDPKGVKSAFKGVKMASKGVKTVPKGVNAAGKKTAKNPDKGRK